MKKNPYLTFSLIAGAVVVAYLIYNKKRNKMAVPSNVDVAKPSSSGGSGGGGVSAPRMATPSTPIITPPVVVIPQSTTAPTTQITPTTPLTQNTAGAPTRTTVDNPDQDRVLGGAIVPPTSTTVQTSSGTLSVPTTSSPPALGKSGGMAG
jgi:hypothetical protein